MSTDLAKLLEGDGDSEDAANSSEPLDPAVDEPYDLRPDLSDIGIIEMERGVCEDTYENRATLRRAKLQWQPVYDQSGAPTGLIAARSAEAMKERRLQSLAEKRPLLSDPDNKNSDYLTGLDLLLEDRALKITPPWVVGATKAWRAEQEAGGPPTNRRAPKGLPHRCRMVKSDGIRCLLWASGRPKDDGLCRVHLRHLRKPGEDIERARRKIIQAAPYAVDVLEDLMENAESEPVRLKASTEILDRAGIRGGQDLNVEVEVIDSRPAAQVVAERLARLADGAQALQARLDAIESGNETDNSDIVDAEVVEEETVEAEAVETSTTDSEVGPRAGPTSPPDHQKLEEEFEDLEEEAASS
jgi:hypothetical protein